MRILRNERGAAVLLYILMIFAILAIFIPVILNHTSNTALSDRVSYNEKAATQLAVSAIDTFIQYLDQYNTAGSTTRPDYVNQYGGFLAKEYTLPDLTPVTFSLTKVGPTTDSIFTITASAEVGSGASARTKTVTYKITASTAGSIRVTPDTSERTPVPISPEAIYVGGTPTGVPSSVGIKQEQVQAAIATGIEYYKSKVLEEMTSYQNSPTVFTCSCSTFEQINNAITSSTANPDIIRITNDFSDSADVTLGSPTNPVILIFDSNVTFPRKIDLTVYGNIFIKGRWDPTNQTEVRLLQSNNNYGNLYTLGAITPDNQMTLSVPGTLYAGSMISSSHNGATITAGRLVIETSLEVNNGLTLSIGSDMLVGSITVQNNAVVTASAGDILVANDFTANNNISLTTGGNIAVGGDATFHQGLTINTGGATTSLIFPNTDTSTGGSSNPSSGWNPTRQ